jgi:hypothetical protein
VELELDQPEHQVLRRSPSGFSLIEPPGFEVDGELATNAVLGLGSLTAVAWAADADDGSFGLSAPRLTAGLRFETGDAGVRERVLVVGSPVPGGHQARFADEPGVFVLERSLVDRLQTLLVDRASTMVDPSTVSRVTLTKGQTRHVLERRGAELVPAAGTRLDPGLVEPVLESLAALRAEAAMHSGAALRREGLGEPSLVVLVEPKKGLGRPRTLSFGAEEVFRGLPVRFARVTSVDATFVVSSAKARPLFDLF